MSALAARRAAAAASVTEESTVPLNTETSRPVPGPSKRAVVTGKRNVSVPDAAGSSSESTPGPSKRRRVATAPSASSKTDGKSGVAPGGSVEAPSRAESKVPNKRKAKRAFSPSRPVADYDETSSQASERDSSEDEQEISQPLAVRDGARDVRWSLPSTPGQTPGHTPGPSGPSRYSNQPSSTIGYTKTFVAKEGTNVYRLPLERLRSLGLAGEEEGLLVVLQSHESLMLSGCFSLVPLRGSISLFSTTLSPSNPLQAHPVFAPLSHPLPVIAPAPSSSSKISTAAEDLIKELLSTYDGSAASIFILRELRTGVEGLSGGAVPTFSTSFSTPGGFQGVWELPPEPSYPYFTPESWNSALRTLRPSNPVNGDFEDDRYGNGNGSPPVVLVKGPKRSGKSSIGRAALNTLLEAYAQVAWLECDLGQGEFSAGGVVGLWILDRPVLGPPFTHPQIPVRTHFLGTYTPVTCPEEYLAAIHHICEYHKFEVQYSSSASPLASASHKRNDVVPLVVNTPGWVKGLGEDLLRSIEAMIEPTHTFQFPLQQWPPTETDDERPAGWTSSPPVAYSSLPGNLASDEDATGAQWKTVLELPAAPVLPLQARYAASDHRQLSLLSYVYSRLPSTSLEVPKWDFRIPLASQAPYEVLGGETIKEIYLVGEGSDGILADDLSLALNGSVVALLERLAPPLEPSLEVYVQGREYPSLEETNFLGYAFVRAVAFEGEIRKLRLLTPLPASLLSRVSIMVRNGAMEMPNAGMVDGTSTQRTQGQRQLAAVPFFDDGPIGVGGERRKIRRNLMRKGM